MRYMINRCYNMLNIWWGEIEFFWYTSIFGISQISWSYSISSASLIWRIYFFLISTLLFMSSYNIWNWNRKKIFHIYIVQYIFWYYKIEYLSSKYGSNIIKPYSVLFKEFLYHQKSIYIIKAKSNYSQTYYYSIYDILSTSNPKSHGNYQNLKLPKGIIYFYFYVVLIKNLFLYVRN